MRLRVKGGACCLFGVASLLLLPSAWGRQQAPQHRETNPPAPCGDQSVGIPGFYYDAVVARFEPPGIQNSLIRISMGAELKIVLMTDGQKFQIWTDTPETPERNVNQFLMDLDESCRLPPDPADAAKLIPVNWESREISAAQFAQIHRDFLQALSQYSADAQRRYANLLATRLLSIWPDAVRYPITYYNNNEHIEVQAWDVARDPMVKWVHELQQLAAEKFGRPFGP